MNRLVDAGSRRHRTAGVYGQGLERPCRRRAHGDDATAFAVRPRDGRRGVGRDRVVLLLHSMFVDLLGTNRLEGAVADVQRDRRAFDAAGIERREQLRREVQSRGRCGNRAAVLRVDRLIAIAIGRRIVALDIRRQWHVADAIDDFTQGPAFGHQPNEAPSMKTAGTHFAANAIGAIAELEPRSFLEPLPGMHQRLPRFALVIDGRCAAPAGTRRGRRRAGGGQGVARRRLACR